MLAPEHVDFLDKLQTYTYPNDDHIITAINYAKENSELEDLASKIEASAIMINNWDGSEEKKPQPSSIICCLVGPQIYDMDSTIAISKFGFETYQTAITLSEIPHDYDDMPAYFEENSHDISLLYLTTAVQNLQIIANDYNSYRDATDYIENYVNLGLATNIDVTNPLSQKHHRLTEFFIGLLNSKETLTQDQLLNTFKPNSNNISFN